MKFCGFKAYLCNLLCISLLVVAPALNAQASSFKWLLMGDSLSASYGVDPEQGWVNLLNQQSTTLPSAWQIINASISGETSKGGLQRLNQALDESSVDGLIIELGGNDGLRGYPPKQTRENLQNMIDIGKQRGLRVAIMQIEIPPNYGSRYTSAFRNIFSELAEQNEIDYLPFFMQELATQPDYMQDDGIHPNTAAQPILAELMVEMLQPISQTP
ncbi:arylesterase [Alginatibacterium sediminis]|uniref:Arylesterase n=1 Tax=Alginatibacterium sediminis TaxID=2164068 RepID=A0A420EGC8_9ALTE|nr:arylesterase [Alginatibacterium sediminis]RKF19723.1 arylesterase [Alginatibacterium sediminis]